MLGWRFDPNADTVEIYKPVLPPPDAPPGSPSSASLEDAQHVLVPNPDVLFESIANSESVVSSFDSNRIWRLSPTDSARLPAPLWPFAPEKEVSYPHGPAAFGTTRSPSPPFVSQPPHQPSLAFAPLSPPPPSPIMEMMEWTVHEEDKKAVRSDAMSLDFLLHPDPLSPSAASTPPSHLPSSTDPSPLEHQRPLPADPLPAATGGCPASSISRSSFPTAQPFLARADVGVSQVGKPSQSSASPRVFRICPFKALM